MSKSRGMLGSALPHLGIGVIGVLLLASRSCISFGTLNRLIAALRPETGLWRLLRDPAVFFALSTAFAAVAVAILVFSALGLSRTAGSRHALGIRPFPLLSARRWLWIVILFDCAAFGLWWLSGLTLRQKALSDAFLATQYTPLMWAVAVLDGPLVDELLFRGYLFVSLRQSAFGVNGTILLTAFLSALPHYSAHLPGMLLVFGLGLVLGQARLKSDSLSVPFVMHAVHSLVATLLGTR